MINGKVILAVADKMMFCIKNTTDIPKKKYLSMKP